MSAKSNIMGTEEEHVTPQHDNLKDEKMAEESNVTPDNSEYEKMDEEENFTPRRDNSKVEKVDDDHHALTNDRGLSHFPDKDNLKCTPAIQKLRKGLAEFDVRSPSDAMMSPVTAKLSQVRHTMKQSDAIRQIGTRDRKNPPPKRLSFDDE